MHSLGIIIIGTIILFLLGFGCRSFFINADVPLALRVGVGIIGGGILFLVVRLVKARLTRAKGEKPKAGNQ